jgi:hypothetical protein
MVDEGTKELLAGEIQRQLQQVYSDLEVSINNKVESTTHGVGNEIRAEVKADRTKLESELGEHLASIQKATLDSVAAASASASTSAATAMEDLQKNVGVYYNERMDALKKEVARYSQGQITEFEKKAVVERDRAHQALTLVENSAKSSVENQGAQITAQLREYVEQVKGEDQKWKRVSENELSEIKIGNGRLLGRLDDKDRTLVNQNQRLAHLEGELWRMEVSDPQKDAAIQQALDKIELMFPDWGKMTGTLQSMIQAQGDMQNEQQTLRQMITQQGMSTSSTQGHRAGYQGGGGHPRSLNVSQFTKTLLKWSGGQERNGTRTDPVSWLYKFNSLAEIENLSGPERGKVIVFLLEGSALDWYNSQTDAVREDWTVLSQHFLNEYTVRNEQEEAAMKLTSIRESDYIAAGKDFRVFQDAFRGLCNKAGTSATESQRVQSYIMAMDNQKIRNDLMESFLSSKKVGARPLVLHQVIEMSEDKKLATQAAHRVPVAVQQMTRANMAAQGQVQGTPSDAGSIGPSVSQIGGQGQMDLDALHSMQHTGYSRYASSQISIPGQSSSRNDGHSEVGSVPSVRCETSSTIASLSQQMAEISDGLNAFNEKNRSSGPSQKETRECYNCGIKGHLIADCRKPKNQGAAPRSASQEARDRDSSGRYEKRGNTPTRTTSPGGTPYKKG